MQSNLPKFGLGSSELLRQKRAFGPGPENRTSTLSLDKFVIRGKGRSLQREVTTTARRVITADRRRVEPPPPLPPGLGIEFREIDTSEVLTSRS